MECIAQTLSGAVAANSTATATISRNSDLIHRMYYEVDSNNALNNNLNNFGTQLKIMLNLKSEDRELTDIQDILETYFQLTKENHNGNAYTVKFNNLTVQTAEVELGQQNSKKWACGGVVVLILLQLRNIYVPLQFWFCETQDLLFHSLLSNIMKLKLNLLFQQHFKKQLLISR